jgi:two-component system chemotaxis response regulator CheB
MGPSKNVVVIGISTGGPSAMNKFLPKIPPDIDAGILIVQHIPEEFTGTLARRLNSACQVEVKEAENGDVVRNGRVLLARGGHHLGVERKKYGVCVFLDKESKPDRGHRPSVDYLFRSVEKVYGRNCVAVIMTGMGMDGTDGMKLLKGRGALTIAQDEESSVIFGMPRSAIEAGVVDEIVSLENMADKIVEAVGRLGVRR